MTLFHNNPRSQQSYIVALLCIDSEIQSIEPLFSPVYTRSVNNPKLYYFHSLQSNWIKKKFNNHS